MKNNFIFTSKKIHFHCS